MAAGAYAVNQKTFVQPFPATGAIRDLVLVRGDTCRQRNPHAQGYDDHRGVHPGQSPHLFDALTRAREQAVPARTLYSLGGLRLRIVSKAELVVSPGHQRALPGTKNHLRLEYTALPRARKPGACGSM
jgi:hypothetical protein